MRRRVRVTDRAPHRIDEQALARRDAAAVRPGPTRPGEPRIRQRPVQGETQARGVVAVVPQRSAARCDRHRLRGHAQQRVGVRLDRHRHVSDPVRDWLRLRQSRRRDRQHPSEFPLRLVDRQIHAPRRREHARQLVERVHLLRTVVRQNLPPQGHDPAVQVGVAVQAAVRLVERGHPTRDRAPTPPAVKALEEEARPLVRTPDPSDTAQSRLDTGHPIVRACPRVTPREPRIYTHGTSDQTRGTAESAMTSRMPSWTIRTTL